MRRSRAEWQSIIDEFEAASESHEQFCARRKLNVGSFRGWLYRLREERSRSTVARSATAMVPVVIRPPAVTRVDGVVEIALRPLTIRAPVGADPNYLSELAAALASRC